MKIFKNITDLIGNTPLLELETPDSDPDIKASIYGKIEEFNPSGSSKARVALEMINDAEQKGLLKKGSVIIEPTSGNTGIGLAMVAAVRGYRMIIVMPDSMSIERRNLMAAYGAEVVLTKGSEGMTGAIKKAEELSKSIEGSFIPAQFDNSSNPIAHEKTTGPEIWNDTDGKVDIFVAGAGTGGTISGTGKYLKSKNPSIYICAVEPKGSPVLSEGHAGPHKLQGIGAGFIPTILDTEIYDEVIAVSDEDAYETGRKLSRRSGLLSGISGGAAVFAAIQLAKRPENAGKNIVVLIPDSGERYLSTPDYLI